MDIQNSISTRYPISGMEQMLLIAIPIIAVLGLLLTLGVSIYHSSRKCQSVKKNATVPLLCANARITSKWVTTSANGGEQYFATFAIQEGQALELLLPQAEYQRITEGDAGELSYQGNEFLRFLSNKDEGRFLHE